jgi:hypothetical protein
MMKLNTVNKTDSLGDCYVATLVFIKDIKYINNLGLIPINLDTYLVHGIVSINNVDHKHAWVEIGEEVLELSNKQRIKIPKEQYYINHSARPKRKFTREEVNAYLTMQNKKGFIHLGYWGDVSDAEILESLSQMKNCDGILDIVEFDNL